jgi:hypothetical protein
LGPRQFQEIRSFTGVNIRNQRKRIAASESGSITPMCTAFGREAKLDVESSTPGTNLSIDARSLGLASSKVVPVRQSARMW